MSPRLSYTTPSSIGVTIGHRSRALHERLSDTHAKGFTATTPTSPKPCVARYAGDRPRGDRPLAAGVTAVELMPVHHIVQHYQVLDGSSELTAVQRSGSSLPTTVMPPAAYGNHVQEFRPWCEPSMRPGARGNPRRVYNHTAEEPPGPVPTMNGIDNHAVHRLGAGTVSLHDTAVPATA